MLKCWTHAPSHFPTRESLEVACFLPHILHWARGRDSESEWMSAKMCLCSQWPPTWCPFLSGLRFRQQRSQLLWQLPHSQNQKSEHCMCSPFSFPPPGRSQVLGIFSWSHHTELKGGSIMSVCRWFDVHLGWRRLLTGFWISYSRNWFNWCLGSGEEVLGLPCLPSF